MKSNNKETKAQKESRYERGEDNLGEFDLNQGVRTINLDLPLWAIKALDIEATRRGVARQALIKMWIVDRLDNLNKKQAS